MRESLYGRVISRSFWPLHFPDLTSCDFYLWVTLKDEVRKTILHTLEELRNNIHIDISTISGEELRTENKESRSFTEYLRLRDQYLWHLL